MRISQCPNASWRLYWKNEALEKRHIGIARRRTLSPSSSVAKTIFSLSRELEFSKHMRLSLTLTKSSTHTTSDSGAAHNKGWRTSCGANHEQRQLERGKGGQVVVTVAVAERPPFGQGRNPLHDAKRRMLKGGLQIVNQNLALCRVVQVRLNGDEAAWEQRVSAGAAIVSSYSASLWSGSGRSGEAARSRAPEARDSLACEESTC